MRALVPLALAAVLPLTACSDVPGVGGGSEAVTGDLAVAVAQSDPDDDAGAGSVDGADGLDRPVVLRMPQVSVRLDRYAVSDDVDADDTGLSGLDGVPDADELTAPDGSELVLADLTLEPGAFSTAPAAGRNGPYELAAVVDGEERPIAADTTLLPGAAEPLVLTVALAVPVDAPVLLQVTDAGRSGRIDLRTGEVADDPVSRAVGRPASSVRDLGRPVTTEGTAESTADNVEAQIIGATSVSVSAALDQATVATYPWVPTKGWAREGRTWLVVDVPVLVAGFLQGRSLTLSLRGGAITATPVGGRPAPSAFGLDVTVTSALDRDPSLLAFEVARADSYLLRIDAAAGLLPGARWVRRPAPIEADLVLAP